MKDQLVKVVDGVVKLVEGSETFWTPETIKPEIAKAEAPQVAYPTILRKDRRFCTGMINCHLYDKEKDGEPCTVDIERCEYIKYCFGKETDTTKEIDRLKYEIKNLRKENGSLQYDLDDAVSEKDSIEGEYFKLKIQYGKLIAEVRSISPEIASKYEEVKG
jgi:hypothetical protein